MDDLTLVRTFRDTVPTFTPSSVDRDRLLRSIQERGRHPRAARRRRALVLVPAGLTALALTVVVQTGPEATPGVAGTLHAAAATVAGEPTTEPAAGQWVYENWVQAGDQDQTAGYWTRYDGKLVAERAGDGGRVHIEPVQTHSAPPSPETWYQTTDSLPDDPQGLLAQLRTGSLVQAHGSTQAARDFDAVTRCLAQPGVLSPRAHARLFQALATIPGTSIDEHAAPDLLGRPVLSVTFAGDTIGATVPSRHELLLDPKTYAFRGERVTALADGDIGGSTGKSEHVTSGQVWFDGAMKDSAVVDQPGATS